MLVDQRPRAAESTRLFQFPPPMEARFVFLFWRQVITVQPWQAWNLGSGPDWPWTTIISASRVHQHSWQDVGGWGKVQVIFISKGRVLKLDISTWKTVWRMKDIHEHQIFQIFLRTIEQHKKLVESRSLNHQEDPQSGQGSEWFFPIPLTVPLGLLGKCKLMNLFYTVQK